MLSTKQTWSYSIGKWGRKPHAIDHFRETSWISVFNVICFDFVEWFIVHCYFHSPFVVVFQFISFHLLLYNLYKGLWRSDDFRELHRKFVEIAFDRNAKYAKHSMRLQLLNATGEERWAISYLFDSKRRKYELRLRATDSGTVIITETRKKETRTHTQTVSKSKSQPQWECTEEWLHKMGANCKRWQCHSYWSWQRYTAISAFGSMHWRNVRWFTIVNSFFVLTFVRACAKFVRHFTRA